MIGKANALGALGITLDARGPDKPATSVSWFEAAEFVNWLNTSTGHSPAYKFIDVPAPRPPATSREFALWAPSDPGYDAGNLFRNRLAKYVLPSVDEWYKAAYYDPTAGVYWGFPTGSNSPPTPVASGTMARTAVFQDVTSGPADIMQAGGLSPYETMAQGGNVTEWLESEFDLINDSTVDFRERRGGLWQQSALSSTARGDGLPNISFVGTGFRVVQVIPEPSTIVLLGLGVLLLTRRPRR